MFQAALLQIAEATREAANAAKAPQNVAAASASAGTGTGGAGGSGSKQQIDWSKLVSKPPFFRLSNTGARSEAFQGLAVATFTVPHLHT